jgi:cytochrome c oxidase assembly factor CtaG
MKSFARYSFVAVLAAPLLAFAAPDTAVMTVVQKEKAPYLETQPLPHSKLRMQC